VAAKKAPAKKASAKRKSRSGSSLDKSADQILAKIMSDAGLAKVESIADSYIKISPSKPSNLRLPSDLTAKIKLPTHLFPKIKRLPRPLPKNKLPANLLPRVKVPVQLLSKFKVSVIRVPKFKVPVFKIPVRQNFDLDRPRTNKDSLPLVIVAAAVAIIIAGFWGPQIVRSLGIPIDPKPYTAIYFQDPTIVQTGIVAGDLVIFGVHNGYRNQRNLTWHMDSGSAQLARGQVIVDANGDSQLAVSSTGALPGQLIKIYVEGTSAPITIQVVG
jgi:hypothetical protein